MINLFLYPKQVYKTVYLIIAFEVVLAHLERGLRAETG